MSEADGDSNFLDRVNAGTTSAYEEIDRRYRERLCALVQRELGNRFAAREDPEDAVQSAMRSFFRGVRARLYRIDHAGALWALLATITRRKVLKHVEHHDAIKRRPGDEVLLTECSLCGREPSPEDVAIATDLIATLTERLDQDEVDILRHRLAGLSREQIAVEMGGTVAQIAHRLARIRQFLTDLVGEDEMPHTTSL